MDCLLSATLLPSAVFRLESPPRMDFPNQKHWRIEPQLLQEGMSLEGNVCSDYYNKAMCLLWNTVQCRIVHLNFNHWFPRSLGKYLKTQQAKRLSRQLVGHDHFTGFQTKALNLGYGPS